MNTQSYKVADKLFLVRQSISKTPAPAKPVEVPTNHLVIIDCSGSMSGDLPKIREQLKKKLPRLIGDKDTLSVIWFSSRGEFGTLIEAEPVSTLADLNDVNKAIDRWLRPVGMTGFKEPLEEASKLVERVGKKRPGSVFSLFFMSDGCDNQWNRADILKVVEKAAKGFSAATFVEYGYYADRPLLTAMAEKAGGQLIFSEAFDKYQPLFEAAMAKRPTGAPRIEVAIPGDPIGGFVWSQVAGDLTTYGLEAAKASVPEDTAEVWFLSPSAVGSAQDFKDAQPAAYAAMSLFSVRMKPEIIFPFLKATGDVKFIEQFSSCFGKQKYSAFMDDAKAAAFDSSLRLTKGYDPNKVPRDDAFTVLQLLQLLASSEENRVLLDHKDFTYSAIGRGRVDASEVLTADEQKKLTEITTKMASEKNAKKLKELQEELAQLTSAKGESLKFEPTPTPEGYSISSLTFNEDRPNVSFNIRKEGTVDISARIPDALKGKTLGKIPEKFSSFIFRNYAVIRDGLVNVKKLPVRITEDTFNQLVKVGVLSGTFTPEVVLDVEALPVINRQMVKAVSAKALFEKQFTLEKARAAQKVYKAYRDEKFPKKTSESFKALYGDDGALWLKEQGFTDYSGYAPPHTVTAEAKDFYMGKELPVSLKGYSSLPSMNDLKKQAAKGKYNGPGALMAVYVKEVEDFLASDIYQKASDKDHLFETWVKDKSTASISEARKLIFEIAQIKFAIVVGQVWFNEFKSVDENEMTVKVDGLDLACKVEMKEIEVRI